MKSKIVIAMLFTSILSMEPDEKERSRLKRAAEDKQEVFSIKKAKAEGDSESATEFKILPKDMHNEIFRSVLISIIKEYKNPEQALRQIVKLSSVNKEFKAFFCQYYNIDNRGFPIYADTLLETAIENGWNKLSIFILDNINLSQEEKNNALKWASLNDTEIENYLIASGANIEVLKEEPFNNVDILNFTHSYIIENKNLLFIKYLITSFHEYDLSFFGPQLKFYYADLMYYALQKNKLNVVKLLLKELPNHFNMTSLYDYALANCNWKFLKLFKTDEIAAEDDTTGDVDIMKAIRNENAFEVNNLLESGIDIDYQDMSGNTALLEALKCEIYNGLIIGYLISYKANVNIANSAGETPLMCACNIIIENNDITPEGEWEIRKDIIESLLNCGADLNAKNTVGETSLIYAIDSGCVKTIGLLLSRKINANTVNINGQNVLMHIAEVAEYCDENEGPISIKNQREIVRMIVKYGVNINAQDENGLTALMYFVKYENIEVVKLLLSLGADKNIMNHEGLTAYNLAIDIENYEIANLLKKTNDK